MNIFKKISVFIFAALMSLALLADTVNLSLNPSPDTNVVGYSFFAVPGSNTVFSAGNTNAAYSVSVTNTVSGSTTNASLTGLHAGWWTFTANAFDGLGNTSVNCSSISYYIPVASPSGLRVINVTVP